jgi:hypothetical protein
VISEDWVTSSSGPIPHLLFSNLAQVGRVAGFPIPPACIGVATSVQLFYPGGGSGDEVDVSDGNTAVRWLDWRPETTNVQSHDWAGWQVFEAGNFIVVTTAGTFDIRICGWLFGA